MQQRVLRVVGHIFDGKSIAADAMRIEIDIETAMLRCELTRDELLKIFDYLRNNAYLEEIEGCDYWYWINKMGGYPVKPNYKKLSDYRNSLKDEKIVAVKGVTIHFKIQKVSHPKLGNQRFKPGKAPWRILRICAEEEPDGLGVASLESLSIAESDIYKKLDLINKHFKKPIIHFKDGLVFIDPDLKS